VLVVTPLPELELNNIISPKRRRPAPGLEHFLARREEKANVSLKPRREIFPFSFRPIAHNTSHRIISLPLCVSTRRQIANVRGTGKGKGTGNAGNSVKRWLNFRKTFHVQKIPSCRNVFIIFTARKDNTRPSGSRTKSGIIHKNMTTPFLVSTGSPSMFSF